jgi:hypothetical protein
VNRVRLAAMIGGSLVVVALAAGGIVLLTRSTSHQEAAPEPETTTTTATTVPLPRWPLTDLPDAAASGPAHPAIVVKMDNSSDARPQTGINQADVVYELLVEGITRFALVYHSNLADPVGPVRSARSSDIDLVADLSTPLFAWSGGNAGVTQEVYAAARNGILIDSSYSVATDAYYRSDDRIAPHNLYVHLPQLLQMMAPPAQGNPTPIFAFKPSPTATNGPTSSSTSTTAANAGTIAGPGLTVDFGGAKVDYAWDAQRQGWDRFQVDGGHGRESSATIDPSGQQVAPANVVVMFVDYGVSPADIRSPMALTVGDGPVIVFSGGRVRAGNWSRSSRDQPAVFTDLSGDPMLLTPGRTWVELPSKGSSVAILDQPAADALLAVRH